MPKVLATLLGARLFSHYAAGPSSTPVLVSALGIKNFKPVVDVLQQTWRSFKTGTAPPVDATASSESHDLKPLGLQEDGVFASSIESVADVNAAVPASNGGLEQLKVPTHVLHDLRPPARPYQLTPILSQRPTGNPAHYTPWTPTRALQRRKHITKRMGFLMQVLEREQVERVRAARPLPDFRAGDILEVRMMLPEAERKVTIYRGVCIARYQKGIRSTFKIYNVYPECGGVVQHIPLYMPDLLGIKVVGRIHSSQERLFYLLDRETSDYTFQTGVSAAS